MQHHWITNSAGTLLTDLLAKASSDLKFGLHTRSNLLVFCLDSKNRNSRIGIQISIPICRSFPVPTSVISFYSFFFGFPYTIFRLVPLVLLVISKLKVDPVTGSSLSGSNLPIWSLTSHNSYAVDSSAPSPLETHRCLVLAFMMSFFTLLIPISVA